MTTLIHRPHWTLIDAAAAAGQGVSGRRRSWAWSEMAAAVRGPAGDAIRMGPDTGWYRVPAWRNRHRPVADGAPSGGFYYET